MPPNLPLWCVAPETQFPAFRRLRLRSRAPGTSRAPVESGVLGSMRVPCDFLSNTPQLSQSLKSICTKLEAMKRYPTFDPPEYLDWKPDPAVMEEYQETLARQPERAAILAALSREQLTALYAGMVRFRLHDITLRRWVMQGILSKA